MSPKIEHGSDQLKVLIVDENTHLGSLLKNELKKHESEIFVSPRPPENLHMFNWCFFINPKLSQMEQLLMLRDTRVKNCIALFFDHKKQAEAMAIKSRNKNLSFKFITLAQPDQVDSDDLEKILWFAFSRSEENILHLQTRHRPKQPVSTQSTWQLPKFNLRIKPRTIPFLILGILLLLHLLFIPPLALSTLNLYRGTQALTKKNFEETLSFTKKGQEWLKLSKNLYGLARPTLSLFSISSATDDIFQVNETTIEILNDSQKLYQQGSSLMALLFKNDKSQSEIDTIINQKKELEEEISGLEQKIQFIQDKLPAFTQLSSTKKELQKTLEALQIGEAIIPHFDNIFAKDTEKTYLFLFANNMEIRPGGGFIGSFGLMKVANYTIKNIKVYDVYDADGQLTEHVEPPSPIRDYLDQPNWFLRDSAFSPDFLADYDQAKLFLQKEMGLSQIDGAVLLTTSTVQSLLGAVGELYIPDYQEKVNKDNFYLKAQLYAEKDFFPGSIQKKQFLGAVTDQLMLKLEGSFSPAVLLAFKKSLDEKQMVIHVDDPKVQETIDSLYWSGRVIEPSCTNSALDKNCVNDYLFSYDANLGVNKANFYVKRAQNIKVNILKDGSIHDVFTLNMRNEATNDTFPGGTYKNYLQIMVPKGATLKSVTKNGSLVEHVDITESMYKTIGLLVEIKPGQRAIIVVSYELPEKLEAGAGQYQLIVQKQIGSSNSDLQVDFDPAINYQIGRRNFAGLVKDRQILYNTSLSADKIFLVELTKE